MSGRCCSVRLGYRRFDRSRVLVAQGFLASLRPSDVEGMTQPVPGMPRDHVEVDMEHGLRGSRTVTDQKVDSLASDERSPQGARQVVSDPPQVHASRGVKSFETNGVPTRHDEEVPRGNRVEVHPRHHCVVLVDDARFGPPSHDAAEDAPVFSLFCSHPRMLPVVASQPPVNSRRIDRAWFGAARPDSGMCGRLRAYSASREDWERDGYRCTQAAVD
jgi:hypothetical protein